MMSLDFFLGRLRRVMKPESENLPLCVRRITVTSDDWYAGNVFLGLQSMETGLGCRSGCVGNIVDTAFLFF